MRRTSCGFPLLLNYIYIKDRSILLLKLIQWLCLFKKYWERGLQFVWKCHIIHSVLETQALLIFLEVIDEEN